MRKTFANALFIGLLAVFLAAQAAFILAQQPPQSNGRGSEVRALNTQLLEVYARLTSLPAGASAAAVHSQAATVMGLRAGVLESLIEENPAEALSLAFSADLLRELAAAFPGSASQLETVGEWEGAMEVTVEDGVSLTTHRTIHRMSIPGATLNLHFAKGEPVDLESGYILRVRGMRVHGEVAAADGGTVTGVAGAAICSSMGAQRSIVLLVNMPGTQPPDITTGSVHDFFFSSSGRSVSEFWRENSYGKAWAEGDVRGWYTLDANYTCSQYPSIRDAAVRAADSDVDFSQYSRVFVIISGMSGSCGWAGIANVGCGSTIRSSEGSFVMSAAWMLSDYFSNRDYAVKLTTHEGGHSLGLSHASARAFGAEPLGAPGVAGTLDEYGDIFSTMGSWNLGHYAAPHKARLGWMTDYLTVSTNGSFGVQPVEYPSTLQALKIQRGTSTSNFVWVEFRKSAGLYDSTLPSQVYGGGLLHYQDATTGNKSHLLDFTRSTSSFNDPALVGTWTDPYTNLSIGVTNVTSTALNVDVAYGTVPCVPSEPTIVLSPLNPSAYAGEDVNYSVAVTNNDTTACAPRTFTMSSLLPGGWATSFGASSMTVSSSSTGATSMKKTVPVGTSPATYGVNAVATVSSSSIEGAANVTVRPPMLPLSTAVTVPASPVKPNSSVAITALVTQGSASAAGATVVFSLVNPNGTSTKRATADSGGRATWNYKVNPKAPRGSYTVTAQATLGSQSATSAPATFVVE